MLTVERPGACVAYAAAGDADADNSVLLVHGGLHEPMTGERFWVSTGVTEDLLDGDARVLVPDRRWCGGRTDAAFTVHTWEEEAADLAAVIEDAVTGPVHVVGASNGTSAAIHLALARPDLVRTLVLCWPAAPARRKAGQVYVDLAKQVQERGPGVLLEAAEPGRPWSAAGDDKLFRESIDRMDASEAASIVRNSAIALFSGDLLRGVDADDAARLADGSREVWVVPQAHEDDPWHPPEVAAALVRAVAGCRRGPGVPPTVVKDFDTWRPVLAQFLRTALRLISP